MQSVPRKRICSVIVKSLDSADRKWWESLPPPLKSILVSVPLFLGNCSLFQDLIFELRFASKNRKLPRDRVFFMHRSVYRDVKPLFSFLLDQMDINAL